MRLGKRSWPIAVAVVAMAAAGFASPDARAASYHVILGGSGGEAEFSEQFRAWGTRLRDALVMRMGVPTDRVVLLSEPETEHAPSFATTNLESIRGVFAAMADQVTPDDDLYVYLIGHGSYLKNISKFHIPDEDLSATELNELLNRISARRVVVLNSTSSSAGFINVMSDPERIICSATKSVSEVNATEFMGFFIEGLEDGSADRNHDDRISFLEACEQAAELTASWYTTEGLLATEHAIVDDNADGLGSRLPIELVTILSDGNDDADGEEILDGALSRSCFIKDYQFHPDVSQELIDRYLRTLEAVEALKERKPELDAPTYLTELERLLIEAARVNRDIRAFGPAPNLDS